MRAERTTSQERARRRKRTKLAERAIANERTRAKERAIARERTKLLERAMFERTRDEERLMNDFSAGTPGEPRVPDSPPRVKDTMTIKLGSEVTDSITGFTGVVTARTEYLGGCISVEVQPMELHQGIPIKAQWFDESRLGLSDAPTGGPGDVAPSRTAVPSAEYFTP